MLYISIMAFSSINESVTGFIKSVQAKSEDLSKKVVNQSEHIIQQAKTNVEQVLSIEDNNQKIIQESFSLEKYGAPLEPNKNNKISLSGLKDRMNTINEGSIPLNYLLSVDNNFSIVTKPDMEYILTPTQDNSKLHDDYIEKIYNICIKRNGKTIREYPKAKVHLKQNEENNLLSLRIYNNEKDDTEGFIRNPLHPFDSSYITTIQQAA